MFFYGNKYILLRGGSTIVLVQFTFSGESNFIIENRLTKNVLFPQTMCGIYSTAFYSKHSTNKKQIIFCHKLEKESEQPEWLEISNDHLFKNIQNHIYRFHKFWT